ncbi:hypothetical protein [Desulfovibrio sp. TomC]|uniref:hypothetical protein n=1 Tax=Desulfovibrio sp. TomC TaxID=1562888 RepID=UPI0012E237CD|nr:hypothetical protein [Desulfovibrio sp. TomC]
MLNNVEEKKISKNVTSYKRNGVKVVKEGEWYDGVEEMKQNGVFQGILRNIAFDIEKLPRKSEYLGFYYYFQCLNRFSPFAE